MPRSHPPSPRFATARRAARAAIGALALAPAWALAHGGHGLGEGAHWHGTDTLGFVLLAAAVAGGLWWSRRK
jgi:hypothetical protein